MRVLISTIVALYPALASAHGSGDAHSWWTLEPWVVLPLAAAAVLYGRGVWHMKRRRVRPGAVKLRSVVLSVSGMASLSAALIWPLDALSESSFAAHMAQHMLLMIAAPLFFVLGRPHLTILAALPRSLRTLHGSLRLVYTLCSALTGVKTAFAAHAVVVWLWHAPPLFEAAVQSTPLHVLEHIMFFVTAMMLWSSWQLTARVTKASGAIMLSIFSTMVHTGMLGALITFAPKPLYSVYDSADLSWLTPLDDQQLAGLLMWVPASFCYLGAALLVVERFLASGRSGSTPSAAPRN